MAKLIFKNDPRTWHTVDYKRVHLTQVSWETTPNKAEAYIFFGRPNIDYDGSPTAYGPDGIQPPPDDSLGNAWSVEHGWFGVVALREDSSYVKQGLAKIDKRPGLLHKGEYPVIQQAKNGDPKPGYYVSATPNPTGPIYLQNSYVDASQFAFGALDRHLESLGVCLGDYGLAIRHDKDFQSGFYFADMGGWNHALGEGSLKVGTNLGGSKAGRSFNNNFPTSFIVFPKSFTFLFQGQSSNFSDNQINASVTMLMKRLSSAENAREMALLMGFNEVSANKTPQGLTELNKFNKNPQSSPLPKSHFEVVKGLKKYGFDIPFNLNDI